METRRYHLACALGWAVGLVCVGCSADRAERADMGSELGGETPRDVASAKARLSALPH